MKAYSLIILLAPLLGWAIFGLFGKRLSREYVGFTATLTVSASFVCGLIMMILVGDETSPIIFSFGNWISTPFFVSGFDFQIDRLSLVMILVVSGVSALIHYYSIGYMAKDPDYARFFSYMNLFTFFMLLLVMSGNFVMMFIGWEGVGLCSYLLIGFWYRKNAPTQAGKKAFIVNRVGDAAFIAGLMFLAVSPFSKVAGESVKSLSYEVIFGNIISMAENSPHELAGFLPLIAIIALLLFIGACGKSAQIPLHVWLPDAMEGPTPVSALIHAATMVTAGVYMVARSHTLYLMAPEIMALIAIVGAITALLAATVALVQTDIKRVLAYSTISQLGYMFIGCGVGAFFAAIFHLMTHAFFKACLFLGAGSVIHGNAGEQDIRRMGGLKLQMPSTRWTFLIATATIAGFPMMSAFFSKDNILHEAFSLPFAFGWNYTAGVIGFITAAITAVYMYRLYYKTFEGEFRGHPDFTPHESGKSMQIPMWILAALSAVVGLIGVPGKTTNYFKKFLEPVFAPGLETALDFRLWNETHPPVVSFMLLSFLMFAIGFLIAKNLYLLKPESVEPLKLKYPTAYRILWEKYRVDEFYRELFVNPGQWLCGFLWKEVDEDIIDDGLVEGTGRVVDSFGKILRPFQSGYIRTYALYMLLGVLILVILAST
ncbi:MAG TPA: NADH-quinone oxidoreductase subunit L [Firmicutes bacterium]|nr:NADH-quinone oxidoreductase subunit L [Bacillota bacterium]